jgi:hypothetical protein
MRYSPPQQAEEPRYLSIPDILHKRHGDLEGWREQVLLRYEYINVSAAAAHYHDKGSETSKQLNARGMEAGRLRSDNQRRPLP